MQNETIVLFVFIGDFVSVYIRVIIREPINLLTNSINVSSLSTYIEARLFQSKGRDTRLGDKICVTIYMCVCVFQRGESRSLFSGF